jgi:hypothetical protein
VGAIRAWEGSSMSPRRERFRGTLLILDLALNALTTGRPGTPILTKLKRALRDRFALAPQVLGAIFPNIDLWDQQRLLRGGLWQPYKV